MVSLALSTLGGGFLMLLWLSACFAGLGWIYFRNLPQHLGKREDGKRHWGRRLLFLPYIAFVRFVFILKLAFLKESAWDEIHDGLFLGRLPAIDSFPKDVDLVVDLSAELMVPQEIRDGHHYAFYPILNRWIPSLETFSEIVAFLGDFPGRAYVHCSAGKGRSALVVAGVLLRRGLAETAEEAEVLMKKRRPQVALHEEQLLLVNQYGNSLRSL